MANEISICFEILVCSLVVLCDSSISKTAAILVSGFSLHSSGDAIARYYDGICKHTHTPDTLWKHLILKSF